MVTYDSRGMNLFCFLFSLIAAGWSMSQWLPGDQGQTRGQGQTWLQDGQAGPWGQGWANDGMGCQSAGQVPWPGRAVAEQPCCSVMGLGWTALGWAGMGFHNNLEIYVFM